MQNKNPVLRRRRNTYNSVYMPRRLGVCLRLTIVFVDVKNLFREVLFCLLYAYLLLCFTIIAYQPQNELYIFLNLTIYRLKN